jgi:hypothetical protein
MFLKNYTSDVPVSQTIDRIEKVLIKCGVNGIMKEYGDKGQVTALTFQIVLGDAKPWTIRMPANVQKAWDALWLNYADGDKLTPDGMKLQWGSRKRMQKADFRDQAERTAWRIVQDWIEVQMSMVQMQQADFREVFLPYLWDGKRTYYHSLQESGFAGLLPEKTAA